MDCSRRRVLPSASLLVTTGCGKWKSNANRDWPTTDWPESGYDSRNGGAFPEGSLTGDIEEDWSTDMLLWTSPVTGDGTIYAADRGRLRAISLEGGEPTDDTYEATVTGTPRIDEGVIVPTVNRTDRTGNLVRLEDDLSIDWSVAVPGGRPFSPTADADGIVIRTVGATNYVRRDAPAIEWSMEEPSYAPVGRTRLTDLSPTLTPDRVFVPGPDGVRCRDRWTGEKLWHDSRGEVVASPAVDDGTVYAPVVGDAIVALDAQTGNERWSVDASSCWTSPAIGRDAIYATTGFDLMAIERDSGDVLWRFEEPGLRGNSFSNPILAGETVVAGSIGRALSMVRTDDGELVEHVRGNGTYHSHAVASSTLLVADGPTLRAFRPP